MRGGNINKGIKRNMNELEEIKYTGKKNPKLKERKKKREGRGEERIRRQW